jgi:hypothetical protein
LLADPDSLELAAVAQPLVLVSERDRPGQQVFELLVAIDPLGPAEVGLQESAGGVGKVVADCPEVGMRVVLDGAVELRGGVRRQASNRNADLGQPGCDVRRLLRPVGAVRQKTR